MSAAIHITEQAAGMSLVLARYSALKYSVTHDGDTVERNWPNLSSGEELLWQVLASINGQGDAPADDDLAAGLDAINLHYARCALEGVTA